MALFSSLEILREIVLVNELPLREKALFGVSCPYCGKSDRIRMLESPEDLRDGLRKEQHIRYKEAWRDLVDTHAPLGICRFCNNILKLSMEKKKALSFDLQRRS